MKRRKTVSVTPAIGARTVAGVMLTVPIERLVGTGFSGATSRTRASPPDGLSQNFFTPVFYFLSATSPTCDNADDLEFPMRTIRQILLTEYIGATFTLQNITSGGWSSAFDDLVDPFDHDKDRSLSDYGISARWLALSRKG